jgi:hypothetical protein
MTNALERHLGNGLRLAVVGDRQAHFLGPLVVELWQGTACEDESAIFYQDLVDE